MIILFGIREYGTTKRAQICNKNAKKNLKFD